MNPRKENCVIRYRTTISISQLAKSFSIKLYLLILHSPAPQFFLATFQSYHRRFNLTAIMNVCKINPSIPYDQCDLFPQTLSTFQLFSPTSPISKELFNSLLDPTAIHPPCPSRHPPSMPRQMSNGHCPMSILQLVYRLYAPDSHPPRPGIAAPHYPG